MASSNYYHCKWCSATTLITASTMVSDAKITGSVSSSVSSDIVPFETADILASSESTSHAGDSTESVQTSIWSTSATSATENATASKISQGSAAGSQETTPSKGGSGPNPSLLVTLSVPTALAGMLITLFAVGVWTCYKKRK